MALSWEEIHALEIDESYPAAVDALEARLESDPCDDEAIIRLGFNCWYAVVENDRMQANLPTERYAARFMELFLKHRDRLEQNPDFCWAYGVGISLFWYYFPGANEELGKALLERAAGLDSFWDRMENGQATREEMGARFEGRGIFAKYYLAQ